MLLIDNDFERGVATLAEMMPLEKPVAYTSAYDLNGLTLQHNGLVKMGVVYVNPKDFQVLGVTLIRKKGKNVGKNVTSQDMNKSIYEFLKSV